MAQSRFALAGALLVALAMLLRAEEAGGELKTETLKHQDIDRTYHVHFPPDFKKDARAPLVLVLHGGGGQGKWFDQHNDRKVSESGDKRGMVLVFPEGMNKQWNDGREEILAENPGGSSGYDDSGFLAKLIEHMLKEYHCDPQRVYVTGISNGGFMSFRMALEHSNLIAAAAPVTAQVSHAMKDKRPAQPVSLLLINGTQDPLVPYEGGHVRITKRGKSRGQVCATDESIQLFRKANGCAERPEKEDLPDADTDDGTHAEVERYAGGRNGTEVTLVRVVDGGHTWPGGKQYLPEWLVGKVCRDFSASEMIFDFFLAHPKPDAAKE